MHINGDRNSITISYVASVIFASKYSGFGSHL